MTKRLRPAIILLGVAVLAYALLIPKMGFYWDELPMSWIRYELGPAAMTRYFSTNRPVWGLLYQVTTRLLPQVPIYWQVFALLCRWGSAVLVWALVREIWPEHDLQALVAALLFLVYPGFNQQWTAYLYSHFFIVLCFLLLSFLLMLRSFRRPGGSARSKWWLSAAALLLSALNLWMMEYFFVLELLRPFLIFHFVKTSETGKTPGQLLRRTVAAWAPYSVVFAANVLWRLLIFNNQVYHPTLLSKLRAAPLIATWVLLKTVVGDIYEVSAAAWAQAFQVPNPRVDGPRTTVLYAAMVVLTALLAAYALSGKGDRSTPSRKTSMWMIGLGLIAMLAAGVPFWMTGLEITLGHPANRFTLPFMLGVSMIFTGILAFLPVRWFTVLAVIFVALAAGRQALWADAFARDWSAHKVLFWQMYWRAPSIRPDTIVLLNQGPLQFYADNSLTGALNWIYDAGNRTGAMDYVLFYPTSRMGGSLQDLSAGQPVTYDFISEVFQGNTSQTLAFYYAPPGCLRLLDPTLDGDNHFIAEDSMMREAAALSSAQWITRAPRAQMPEIYGPEPAHGWCYYFEQAQLSAQMGDWQGVAAAGDKALQLNDYPNDPVERFVFIEAYAREGNWKRAQELAAQSYKVSPHYVGPLLCKLIDKMSKDIPRSGTKASTDGLDRMSAEFSCLP